ncbi:MAG: delta-60 repeat domain-containing protein [Chthoniobacteraceae bacterium]
MKSTRSRSLLLPALLRPAGLACRALLLTALCLLAPPAHAAPGDLDPLEAGISGNAVFATAVQPDGKIIVGGDFFWVQGVSRNNIARLNADGTLDPGFNPQANGVVRCLAVQPDGKVLLGGFFTMLQPNGTPSPIARQHVARLNADGTLDPGFNPWADNYILSVALQADGKVLLGGYFTTLRPNGGAATSRRFIARVQADGTLDTGFDPKADNLVRSVVVQADGKILLGGDFARFQPNGALGTIVRPSIARVQAEGTLDAGFYPAPNNHVRSVAVQADGKVLLGGEFTSLWPNGAATSTLRNFIARVNADGSLDPGFNPNANGPIHSLAVQANGDVLLGGEFTTLQPPVGGWSQTPPSPTARGCFARLHADGSFDPVGNFFANGPVYGVAMQTDGRMLLTGSFSTLEAAGTGAALTRSEFARVQNDPATQALSVPDATQVLWERGGAGPEISRVTFELSTNGGVSWNPLGPGNRIGTASNWRRTGLALPASGRVRARGATTGGYSNGSSGLIEQVTTFNFSTDADNDDLPDSWELTYWPTTTGQNASDDSDHDGLTNLQELAFGLNPTLPDSALAPTPVPEGGYLTLTLTKHPGVTYEVQSAGTLLTGQPASFSPATTTVLIDNPSTLKVRDNIPYGTPPARFMRVKVTSAP